MENNQLNFKIKKEIIQKYISELFQRHLDWNEIIISTVIYQMHLHNVSLKWYTYIQRPEQFLRWAKSDRCLDDILAYVFLIQI